MKKAVFLALTICFGICLNYTDSFAYSLNPEISSVKMVDTKRKCLVRLAVAKKDKSLKLVLQSKDKYCFGNFTRVEFTLENGSTFSAYGINEDNCEGQLSLGFGGIYRHEEKATELVKHPIISLLIKDAQNEFLFYLNEQQSKEIQSELDKEMSKTYKSI